MASIGLPLKATPKAGLTLFHKEDSGDVKFLQNPSGTADFNLKKKLNNKLTLGMGFTDSTVRKIKKLPGVVLAGDIKVRDDTDVGVSHNIASGATKLTTSHTTKIGGKKTGLKGTYITKGNVFTGEVVSQLTSNKKASVVFDTKQLLSCKLALVDDKFTYEPSYNFVKKAPSLAVSRPLGPGKYRVGWNLKTDDITAEYVYRDVKLVAVKRPGVDMPTVGIAIERAFDI